MLTNTAPTLRAKHAAALPGAAHFKESKQEAAGQPCAMHGCGLNRNIGYQQFCTKHGRESGFLLKRMMCRAAGCDHRAILASVGYCAKDARELGIRIPKYHCSETDCFSLPLKDEAYVGNVACSQPRGNSRVTCRLSMPTPAAPAVASHTANFHRLKQRITLAYT